MIPCCISGSSFRGWVAVVCLGREVGAWFGDRRIDGYAYGLTASIWTRDEERARELGDHLRTGTVFMNRCDYLDPALAWVGVKQSGRGCALSTLGYQQLTRPKSFHLKHASS